jgi:hypothetical protein
MEIFLIKSGYYNEHHVEIRLLYFSFSLLFRVMLKFWLPYGYMMPVKKSLVVSLVSHVVSWHFRLYWWGLLLPDCREGLCLHSLGPQRISGVGLWPLCVGGGESKETCITMLWRKRWQKNEPGNGGWVFVLRLGPVQTSANITIVLPNTHRSVYSMCLWPSSIS